MPADLELRRPRTSTIADVVFPGDLNHHGTYFGGAGLALMSRAAFVAASRECRADVVVAACERVDFHAPVEVGDLVEARATVEEVGNRSMLVAVEVVAETLRTGRRREAMRGTFHMVALAQDGGACATAHRGADTRSVPRAEEAAP